MEFQVGDLFEFIECDRILADIFEGELFEYVEPWHVDGMAVFRSRRTTKRYAIALRYLKCLQSNNN